jgi:excisionase family DNA binding protein
VKAELNIPPELVSAIVDGVVARLKPILSGLQTKPSHVDDLMGVAEVCKYLGGVSRDWIYQRTAGNEIPFVKVGRMIKFRRSDIDHWLSTRSVPAVSPLSAPLPGGRPRDCESHDTGKTHCVIAKI